MADASDGHGERRSDVLKRHARHGTAHAAAIDEILSLLADQAATAPSTRPQPLSEERSGCCATANHIGARFTGTR